MSPYSGLKEKISIKHIGCGRIFEMRPNDFISNGNRCLACSRKGPLKIYKFVEKVMIENDLEYKTEYFIDDCKFVKKLRFDFVVFQK